MVMIILPIPVPARALESWMYLPMKHVLITSANPWRMKVVMVGKAMRAIFRSLPLEDVGSSKAGRVVSNIVKISGFVARSKA